MTKTTSMDELIRFYGLEPTLTGSSILKSLVAGDEKVENLSNDQVEQILAVWDTRNFVPASKFNDKNVDRVKPAITKEEVAAGLYTQEEYDSKYG